MQVKIQNSCSAFGVIGVVGVVTDGSGAGGGVGVIGEKTRIGEAGWVIDMSFLGFWLVFWVRYGEFVDAGHWGRQKW